MNGDNQVLLLVEESVPTFDSKLLSWREWQVLALVEQGQVECGDRGKPMIAPGTARTHLENINSKLGVHSPLAGVRA